ncbi:MAG TPA: hypothetical protein VES20_23945 [Bryobacteraceae bacterium]|nr:hypothetical protein [Bryobacteraceae bacterium]
MTRRTLLSGAVAAGLSTPKIFGSEAGQAALAAGPPGALVERTAGGTLMLGWNFNSGSHGWLPGFADYAVGQSHLDLAAEIRPLPVELGRPQGHRGYYLQGNNRSDDLFMYLRKQLDSRHGLEPSRNYIAHLNVLVASDSPSGCSGVGGAPGEGLYLKAGVFAAEPTTTVVDGHVRLTVDKGQQSVGGRDMQLLGTLANGRPCELPTVGFVMLDRVLYQQVPVRSSTEATLWAAVGTDSAFEGLTGYYIDAIGIALIPV